MILIYLMYLLLLIILLYFFLIFFFDLKIYLDNLYYLKNIEFLQELDSLLLQRAENLHKIGELQDQLSTLLITAQKKSLFDVTLAFLSNNSSLFVGISMFFIVLASLNKLGKSELEVLTKEIIKTQEISHDSHIAITKEAIKTASDIILNDITKLLIRADFTFTSNSDRKVELLFKKLTDLEKLNIETLIQKINDITLKNQLLNDQILQILELLSK